MQGLPEALSASRVGVGTPLASGSPQTFHHWLGTCSWLTLIYLA